MMSDVLIGKKIMIKPHIWYRPVVWDKVAGAVRVVWHDGDMKTLSERSIFTSGEKVDKSEIAKQFL